jgi:hypothetical protein
VKRTFGESQKPFLRPWHFSSSKNYPMAWYNRQLFLLPRNNGKSLQLKICWMSFIKPIRRAGRFSIKRTFIIWGSLYYVQLLYCKTYPTTKMKSFSSSKKPKKTGTQSNGANTSTTSWTQMKNSVSQPTKSTK